MTTAYWLQFLGRATSPFPQLFWKAWVPLRCNFFVWLVLKDCIWCADRLLHRGWMKEYFCPLCTRNLESSTHLFWQCLVAAQVWRHASRWVGYGVLNPNSWPEGGDLDEILGRDRQCRTGGLLERYQIPDDLDCVGAMA